MAFCSGLQATEAPLIQIGDVDRAPLSAPSGVFAGSTGEALIMLGGETPTSRVLALTQGATWQEPAPAVNFTRAWGAVAQSKEEMVLVGGLNADQTTSALVERVIWRDGKLTLEPLPALPVPLAGAGAGIIERKLYVTGGLRSLDATAAERGLYVLDLTSPADGWKELEPLPGEGTFLAAVSAQYDVIQVFGGRVVTTGADGKRVYRATENSWIYRPTPLEATKRRGWLVAAPLPQASAGGASVPSGQAHSYYLGGDSTAETTSPFVLNKAGQSPVWLFHVLIDAWVDTRVALLGTRPAAVVNQGNETVIFAGQGTEKVSSFTPIRRIRDLSWIDYLVIVLYFALLGGIGWYFSKQKESSEQYSLGDRKIAWWAAGISMFATGASAISFMAIPALAFATNLVWTLPIFIYIAGYYVQAHVIFPLLRKLQLTSTFEYLEQRFNLALRLIASAQQCLFLTFGRAAVVLVLPSIAISTTTGLNVFVSVIVMGVLTTIYTAVGGYKAVIWTEVFQGILKFVAPVAMIAVCIYALPGGFSEFIEIGQKYEKFDMALLTWDYTVPALWIIVLSTFMSCTVCIAGDQPMIQRVFSAPEKEVRRVAFMNILCGILIAVVVNVLGLAIFAFFHSRPDLLDAGSQNDQIIPLFSTQGLPVGLAGVVIAAIFASAMATVASNMNSVSTMFVEDFYKRMRPAANDEDRLKILKFVSYLVGFLGTIMALLFAALPIKSMMVLWAQIAALLGGGIVGVYSLGMLTTRANGIGAVTGAIVSIIVAILVKLYTPVHWMAYLPIAIFTCMGVGYLISILTPWANKKNLLGLTVFTPRPDTTPAS